MSYSCGKNMKKLVFARDIYIYIYLADSDDVNAVEVVFSLAGDAPKTFTMWGPEKQLPPGFSRDRLNDQQLLTEHGVRPYAGDMVLGVKWMPENSKKPDAGVDSERGRAEQ